MTTKPYSAGNDALIKVLTLEQTKGYTDKSVIGGIDKFLVGWLKEAKNRKDPRLITSQASKLLSVPYSPMNPAQRSQWIEKVLRLLNAASTPIPPTRGSKEPHKKTHTPAPLSLDSPVTNLKGVSTAYAAKLQKLGVETIRDLLFYFPRRYNDFSVTRPIAQLIPGEEQTVEGVIWEASVHPYRRGLKAVEAVIGDETGNIRAIWFNQVYLTRVLKPNTRVVLSGKVEIFRGRKQFQSPEYELIQPEGELLHTGRVVPVYPLTEGLFPRPLRRVIKEALDKWLPLVEDSLPLEIREANDLLPLQEAIRQAHFPKDTTSASEARRRLAFDELFLIQLGVLSRKREWQGEPGHPLEVDTGVLDSLLKALPFTLTSAQERVLKQVLEDLQKPQPMTRLLQGEVGSGKTVIAAIALLIAVANGYQGAFMAPTEILTEQHFRTLQSLFQQFAHPVWESHFFCFYTPANIPKPVGIGLLTGSLSPTEKEDIHWRIANGGVDIMVGTHALIQGEVSFDRLGVVVVDEQHRFGVAQRAALREKGTRPHLLAMTATPIPRTLALTLYGDLDISILDELPPGRQPVRTKRVDPLKRQGAYSFVRQQVKMGRQAFIICPLIEESEIIETRAAKQEFERLSREVFPDLRLGLLHGRMGIQEKNRVMESFHKRELDILVSTPVVEVGIDVPNATVMMIEGADRFGLSQLHQLRGRIGRGEHESYCILLTDSPSGEAAERLAIIEKTNDGFVIAEEDLRLRGPGEFFGTRQSGFPDLKMATLSDTKLLELARTEAGRLLQSDPSLNQPEHALLSQEVARFWSRWQATPVSSGG